MLNLDEGKAAVRLARGSLSSYVVSGSRLPPAALPPVFQEKRGVFVTLHEDAELRGCIGFPYPVLPLGAAIIDSAIQAGIADPRFLPVSAEELDRIVIEVTILTKPEPLDVERSVLPDAVKVGRHGLIIKRGIDSGLLLPQVATEFGLDSTDFLCQTCLKAGLPVDAWLDEETSVQCFEAQIFSEDSPKGAVIEKVLSCGCEQT